MANREQLKILKTIEKEKYIAKSKHLKVAEQLSGGYSKYKTAIDVMISVGALTVVTSIVVLAVVCFRLAYSWDYLKESDIFPTVVSLIVLITTMVLGHKLTTLDVTPLFALVSLIIILLTNAFFLTGILPWLTVILAGIGLICWGTYRNWFYDIDTKTHRKKTKKRK